MYSEEMEMSTEEMETNTIGKDLFRMAKKGEWEKVVDEYRTKPEVHKLKITSSGDTAVHIAVLHGKEEIVKQLVDQISSPQGGGKEALEIKNDRGDSPLHVAASMGNARKCELIASAYPPLMLARNEDGETPLFLAALRGNKDAAIWLLEAAIREERYFGAITGVESIQIVLFHMARKNKWNEVINIYRWSSWDHKVHKITKSGDTALHIAVSDGQEEIVQELVDILISNEEEGKEALKMKNEQGNTALHVAASIGNVDMCECIAQADTSLVGVRNEDGETPFFLAALHGKKEAFLCFLRICGSKDICEGYNSRRNDGDTILHVAIAGDYFDLAFQIIRLNPYLANYFNEEGFTALHLLASNPSNFKSCSNLGLHSKIIYHCISVDKLKVHTEIMKAKSVTSTGSRNMKNRPKYPENYITCVNLLQLFRNVCDKIMGKDRVPTDGDLERSAGSLATNRAQRHESFPPNYVTCFEFLKLTCMAVLVIFGLGVAKVRQIRDMKQKHTWSRQIMKELLQRASSYESTYTGTAPALEMTTQEETRPYTIAEGSITSSPIFSEEHEQKDESKQSQGKDKNTEEHEQKDESKQSEGKDKNTEGKAKPHKREEDEATILIAIKNGVTKIAESVQKHFPVAIEDKNRQQRKVDTPILIAAKNGITEIVEKILDGFPFAIHDMNPEKKNIVLLAVEHRQPHVYQLLLKRNILREGVFGVVDNEGNSALHLAANLGEYKPWQIPGAALQMQWEIKWYEFVKKSMPPHFFPRYNKQRKTPEDIFTETHTNLVKEGGEWLNKTSESCSVVAALIATVAFATSTTVPGGVNQDSGTPTLGRHPAFSIFAISSVVVLCFLVTAVVMFLAILTSRYQERDFRRDLPRKLLLGLTSLFLSVASILISFCAGDYFVLKDNLRGAVFPVYVVMCLPVTFYAFAQLPLYLDLVQATFEKVPQRSDKAFLL